jgi:hypothetical protein
MLRNEASIPAPALSRMRTVAILTVVSVSVSSACSTKQKTKINSRKTETAVVWRSGLPNLEREEAENVIAKKWGFKFHRVAGCDVSPHLSDSIDRHNKEAESIVALLHGASWQNRFDIEVDREVEVEKRIEAILYKLTDIRKKDAELEKVGNGLHFYMTPLKDSIYKVSIEGYSMQPKSGKWVSYFRALVNVRSGEAKLTSKKIVEM